MPLMLTDKDKLLLVSIGIAVVVCVLNILLIAKPLYDKVSSARRALLIAKTQVQEGGTSIKDEELVSHLKELQTKISDEMSSFVYHYDVQLLLEEFTKLAAKNGVISKQIMPMEEAFPQKARKSGAKLPAIASKISSKLIMFSGEGGYHNIGKFIAALENGPYLITIESLDIIPTPSNVYSHDVKMKFRIKTRLE